MHPCHCQRVRRNLLGAVLGLTLCDHGRAQPAPGRQARIGFVSWFTPSEASQVTPLREGLRELGWQEGQNLELEVHFTQGSVERTRAALQSLVQRKVDVIVVRATPAAHIAKEMVRDLPLVVLVSDPLATGLFARLSRPDANITGLSLQGPDLAGKRLEHLRALMPSLRRVGFLGAADDPNVSSFVRETEAAARHIGVSVLTRLVAGVQAYVEADFKALSAAGAQALLVQPIFTGQQERIVPMAMRYRLPVVSNYAAFAKAGALLTLGPDDSAVTRRAAYFVHRLLQGTRPSELPVEQPSQFTLAINVATARALSLKVPPDLQVSADVLYDS